MPDTAPTVPVVDRALSRRLERAEGGASAAFVDARAEVAPGSGAGWQDVAGAIALFDGVGSPITQTFALGLDGPVHGDDLAHVEAFFDERGAEPLHEVSPLADPGLLFTVFPERGYRPIELTSVLFQPLAPRSPPTDGDDLRVRPIAVEESSVWATTAAQGWATEGPAVEGFMMDLGAVTAASRGTVCFLAELAGEPIAAASLSVQGGVALLSGASTRPEWRGRGAQGALLRARLDYAAGLGCDLAMMGALPGSASQRNAERQGFRIAYTRIKWGRGQNM